MDQEKIGKLIKQIRKENNLTQKELADRLGVTYQAVSKWENGKNAPDIGTMQQIGKEFNMNIDDIIKGEKQSKEKKTFVDHIATLLPLIFIALSLVIIQQINQPKQDFSFKTISSKCSDFKITGSAAYNKDKASIYISNIEFCGKEDKEVYKKIECTLYEKENSSKTEISSCEQKDNLTLEEFLKETNIKVDNYSTACKNYTSNTLSLEIFATTKDNKTITYVIPLKLNDNCK